MRFSFWWLILIFSLFASQSHVDSRLLVLDAKGSLTIFPVSGLIADWIPKESKVSWRQAMSHILTSSSQISSLEGLRLDQVYSLPRVYNTIQEIPYPRGIYLLPPVYREGATEVSITQRRSEMPSASENAVPSKVNSLFTHDVSFTTSYCSRFVTYCAT